MSASYCHYLSQPSAPTRRPAASHVLVLGLGNAQGSDESIGLHVAQALLEHLDRVRIRNIDVVAGVELAEDFLEVLPGHQDLIILTGVQTAQKSAGWVHEISEAASLSLPGSSATFRRALAMLALGRAQGLLMPRRVRTMAMEMADPWTAGTLLTPPLLRAMPMFVNRALNLALQWSLDHVGGRSLARSEIPGDVKGR